MEQGLSEVCAAHGKMQELQLGHRDGDGMRERTVMWERELHLSFILFSNSEITHIARSVTGLLLVLTFSLTISTS